MTYAQVEAQANRLANCLRENGLKRGERVVVYLPNSIPLVLAIFAILKADGVFVVVNATMKKDKLAYILNNCRASALIMDGRKGSLTDYLVEAVPSPEVLHTDRPR